MRTAKEWQLSFIYAGLLLHFAIILNSHHHHFMDKEKVLETISLKERLSQLRQRADALRGYL